MIDIIVSEKKNGYGRMIAFGAIFNLKIQFRQAASWKKNVAKQNALTYVQISSPGAREVRVRTVH